MATKRQEREARPTDEHLSECLLHTLPAERGGYCTCFDDSPDWD